MLKGCHLVEKISSKPMDIIKERVMGVENAKYVYKLHHHPNDIWLSGQVDPLFVEISYGYLWKF